MNNKDIVKIIRISNVRIENTHNGYLFPSQNILRIEYRDKTYRILDLISQKDITDIDYFKVINTNKTKEKTLFEEFK